MKIVVALAALAALTAPAAAGEPACTTSPLLDGYRSTPLVPAFASIAAVGGTTAAFLPFTDDVLTTVPFPTGFSFDFYGVPRTAATISSNGWVALGGATLTSGLNVHVGDPTGPGDAIHVWSDDLSVTDLDARVLYRFDLTPGAETLTVEWLHVSCAPDTGRMSFQAVLHASTHAVRPNGIELRYDREESPPVLLPCELDSLSLRAVSATVGVEPAGGQPGALDPTERGAANADFPAADLRLLPLVQKLALPSASFALEEDEFCHRDKVDTTVFIEGDPCDTPCLVSGSTELLGTSVALPWKFSLLGHHVKSAAMSVDGYLALGEGYSMSAVPDGPLGLASAPNMFIAPWGSDLEAGEATALQYRVLGEPGCRVISFEWHDVHALSGADGDCLPGDGEISLQVKLYEAGAGALYGPDGPGDDGDDCPKLGVEPGEGRDSITLHWDHDLFEPGGFSATVGLEGRDGLSALTVGDQLAAPPLDEHLVRITTCPEGTVNFYGDPSATLPTTPLPELQTNGVAPLRGNAFGLRMVGATPGWGTLVMLDLGGALPGAGLPCPCGGLVSPKGTFWVNVGAPLTMMLVLGPVEGTEPGNGVAAFDFLIPDVVDLAGFSFFAQMGAFDLNDGLKLQLTEGARITIG